MASDHQPLLFEMIRSFTTMAETLNLSQTVKVLNSTRQTVRRHITQLEASIGAELFRVVDRRYELTEAGVRALPEARDILSRGQAWSRGEAGHLHGLFHMARETPDQTIYIQQHPMTAIWDSPSRLLPKALKAWTEAKGQIADPAFDSLRPYYLTFRHSNGSWVCVEIGPRSSYASWYGRDWTLSSVGRPLPSMPEGDVWTRLLSQPYDEVRATGGVRYDHVHSYAVRNPEVGPEAMSYVRLLMGCQFPDKSFALVSFIERTHDIKIHGLSEKRRLAMSDDLLTRFDI